MQGFDHNVFQASSSSCYFYRPERPNQESFRTFRKNCAHRWIQGSNHRPKLISGYSRGLSWFSWYTFVLQFDWNFGYWIKAKQNPRFFSTYLVAETTILLSHSAARCPFLLWWNWSTFICSILPVTIVDKRSYVNGGAHWKTLN